MQFSPTHDKSRNSRQKKKEGKKAKRNACDSETRTRDGLGFVGNFLLFALSGSFSRYVFMLLCSSSSSLRFVFVAIDISSSLYLNIARRTRAKASRHFSSSHVFVLVCAEKARNSKKEKHTFRNEIAQSMFNEGKFSLCT
jgi:hypothetical protein